MVKEGDLYREFTIHDTRFEIRYGYYDEKERYSKYSEVVPIYPDFRRHPQFTPDGHPFVTQMQDICSHYTGSDDCEECCSCDHFSRAEDLFGICTCAHNRRKAGESL